MDTDDLDALIEEATVDAYDEYEQRVGFYTMMEDNLVFPFPAKVIGTTVSVRGIDMKNEERILAKVKRVGKEHTVDILDLEIDDKKVNGSEWIDAYRKWGNYV